MSEPTRGRRVSRESRLLLATVVVCALALVVLARIRFPEQPAPAVETVTPPPLERLAARASYDALAADVQRIEPSIAPRLLGLRVSPRRPSAPRTMDDLIANPGSAAPLQYVPALRVTADVAIALIDPQMHIDGIAGGPADAAVSLVAVDPVRHIARVQLPPAPVRDIRQAPLASLATPAYVIAAEATPAGVTLRPVFLGRGDRFTSARWNRPLLPLGGITLTPGAFMFSLDGEFIGMVVRESGSPAIVGSRDAVDMAAALAGGTPQPVDVGLVLQRLTPALSAALGAEHGVVVSDVAEDSPLSGLFAPADVIVSVGDWSTDDPDQLLLRLGLEARNAVTVNLLREGQPQQVTMNTGASGTDSGGAAAGGGDRSRVPAATNTAARDRQPVESFALERGVGTRVVAAGARLHTAGLLAGDVITRAGQVAAPTPAQVRQLLGRANDRGFAVLVVRRDGRQRVLAVPVPGEADAAR